MTDKPLTVEELEDAERHFYIANGKQWVPRLVAEVHRQRDQIQQLRKEREQLARGLLPDSAEEWEEGLNLAHRILAERQDDG